MAERGEGIHSWCVRARLIAVGMLLTAFVFENPQPASAATDGMVQVTLKEGQSLRIWPGNTWATQTFGRSS